jgi:cysteine protease ATG4
MNNIDLGRYKRIVQYFWDPEPRNEEGVGSRVWCLGREYVTKDDDDISYEEQRTSPVALEESIIKSDKSLSSNAEQHINSRTPSGEETKGHGWPKAFLDDFESRFWLTYRSNFQPIAKSEDPSAALSMTISVRLRSQLVESHGFTSDTGWGCMIRSGQSLLANALSILTLGRGTR